MSDGLAEVPKKTLLDEFELSAILSDPVLLFIVQKLREGPVERGAFHKLLKVKFRNMDKKPRDYFEKLMQKNFVREFEYQKTKPNPDRTPDVYPQMHVGEKQGFYYLIKDFYAIRTPPINLLDKLEEFGLPTNIIKDLRKDIEKFFKSYTNRKITGDDPDVINLFQDQKMFAAVAFLSQKIYKISEFTEEFKAKYQTDPLKLFKVLEQHDFVKIIPIPEKNEQWIVLKTSVEFKEIFPEYLIRNINQLAAENKLDKNFAILALNYLKKSYLEIEKPELLASYQKKEQELREKLQSLVKGQEKIPFADQKAIDKLFTQILEVCNQIGDVTKIDEVQREWTALKAKYLPK